jgi:transcriptional regulator with XRE-family HTH domain
MFPAMTERSDRARRLELAEFLRARRAKVTPAMAGIEGGGRRRTPGLRREEVAHLSGLSTTWYTWLEQGRNISLSAHALSRLAAVLRLTTAERAYVFELAARRDPRDHEEAAAAPSAVFDAVAHIACPSYLIDFRWDAKAWNEAAAHLFVGWLDGPEHNLLRFIFLDPRARSLIRDWPDRARRVIAEFRADYSRHLDDEALRRLVDELAGASEAFAHAWDDHAVVGREGGRRSFHHPRDGLLHFRQVTLIPSNRPDLKLVLLMPDDGELPLGELAPAPADG